MENYYNFMGNFIENQNIIRNIGIERKAQLTSKIKETLGNDLREINEKFQRYPEEFRNFLKGAIKKLRQYLDTYTGGVGNRNVCKYTFPVKLELFRMDSGSAFNWFMNRLDELREEIDTYENNLADTRMDLERSEDMTAVEKDILFDYINQYSDMLNYCKSKLRVIEVNVKNFKINSIDRAILSKRVENEGSIKEMHICYEKYDVKIAETIDKEYLSNFPNEQYSKLSEDRGSSLTRIAVMIYEELGRSINKLERLNFFE